jgi:hypothetical protein
MDLMSVNLLSLLQSRQLFFSFDLASVIPLEFSLKHSITMTSSRHGLDVSEAFVAPQKPTSFSHFIWLL